MRLTLLLLVGQMLGTVTPLILFPELTWSHLFVPTLERPAHPQEHRAGVGRTHDWGIGRGGGLIDDPGWMLPIAQEEARKSAESILDAIGTTLSEVGEEISKQKREGYATA